MKHCTKCGNEILKVRKDGWLLCSDCNKAYQASVRARNRDKINEKVRERILRLRREAIEFLGGSCTMCGISDIRVLEIDHINGGGRAERTKLTGQVFHYAILNGKRRTDDLQVLCANCHAIKTYHDK